MEHGTSEHNRVKHQGQDRGEERSKTETKAHGFHVNEIHDEKDKRTELSCS